jgi:hypothetical protein
MPFMGDLDSYEAVAAGMNSVAGSIGRSPRPFHIGFNTPGNASMAWQ